MCQLLGMNSRLPASLTLSFTGFAQRGGCTDHHSDGWGIAFFESDGDQPGKAARHFVDKESAATSPIAQMLRSYPIKSHTVVAHVRNTQMVIQAATTLAEAIKRRRMCETGMQADVSRLVGLCRDQYEDITRVPELVSECIAEVQRLGMGDIQSAFARNAAWSTSEVDATFSPITCLERPLV